MNENNTNNADKITEISQYISSENVIDSLKQLRLDYLQIMDMFKKHYDLLSNIELIAINGVIDSSKYTQGAKAIDNFIEVKDLLQSYQKYVKTSEENIKDKSLLLEQLDMQLEQLTQLLN